MVANFLFLTCALFGVQNPATNLAPNAIRLERGHELFYRGQFLEESIGGAVQFRRAYKMELRVLVLDAAPKGLDLAFYTIVKKTNAAGERGELENCSVRLELAKVDPQGRLSADKPSDFLVPFDGPATLESGVFVETPEGPLQADQWWRVGDDMRPDRTWRCLGLEVLNGISCLKMEGIQQSDDWDRPRADRAAWRRKDVVWLSRRYGIASRLDRTIERREAAHIEPTQRCRVLYDLQGAIPYPAQLFEERKSEIMQARQFAKLATPLLPNPTKQDPRAFDVLIAKIVKHIEYTPWTPYRDAVLLVKQRVEAAKRGESPPDRPSAEVADLQPVATLGRIAPDFVVGNVFNKESVRLHNYAGRAVLMVFYLPTSSSAEEVLRFAERMHREHTKPLSVLGFALSDDVPALRAQYEDFRLSFPIALGKPLRQRYGVDATPRLIVIDPDGYVRSTLTG
ncbi:MAG TPA: redoxin domain-containing protein, partial [Gemmataceae bacterium]|nr:redoxin domain-containing protein [Gemmataceae bacterium]